MTPFSIVQFCDDPKKISTKSSYPKNIHFSENPKIIEIQNFELQKNDPSLRMYENIRVPYPPGILTRPPGYKTFFHAQLNWA